MRHRHQGEIVETVTANTYQGRSCGEPDYGPVSLLGYSTSIDGSVKDIYDVEIPRFKSLQRQCDDLLLPFNPLKICERSVKSTIGKFYYYARPLSCGHVTEIYKRHNVAPPLQPDHDPRLRDWTRFCNNCVLDACADARAAIHDSLTELAELPATVEYFFDLARRFAALKKVVFKRARTIFTQRNSRRRSNRPSTKPADFYTMTGALASAWLEFRYAIMPMVYSMKDIEEALLTRHRGNVRGRAKESFDLKETFTTVETFPDTGLVVTRTTNITGTLTIRGYAVGQFAADEGRFGFDPISTAWELITLSFVVDWFINIGSWIATFTPFAKGRLCNTGYTMKFDFTCESVITCVFSQPSQDGYVRTQFDNATARTTDTYKEYTRVPSDPPNLPNLSVQLNWKRYLDAGALVRKIILS